MKKLITLILALSLLTGCSLFGSRTKIEYVDRVVEVPVNNIVYARPTRPSLFNVDWIVYGEKNRGDATKYLQDKALMCISTKHYENLGKNMQGIYAVEEGLYELLDKYEAARTQEPETKEEE